MQNSIANHISHTAPQPEPVNKNNKLKYLVTALKNKTTVAFFARTSNLKLFKETANGIFISTCEKNNTCNNNTLSSHENGGPGGFTFFFK